MQYLAPAELRKIAPATQKMPQSDENLISTKAFLRHVEKLGFQPVFAAQGTPHADADEPLKSRHLVVAANSSGLAVALLNSHSIWRRAWIGAGFVFSNGDFIIGAAVPLPRWKGFEDSLQQAYDHRDALIEARDALQNWKPNDFQCRWLTKQFAKTAWLKGHKQPLAKALFDGIQNETAYDAMNIMITAARAGGLPPAPTDSVVPGRKLKPILSPDAVFHAANAAFNVGLAGLAKYKLGEFTFPKFSRSR